MSQDDKLEQTPLPQASNTLRERRRIEDELRGAMRDLEGTSEELRKQSEWLRITLASIADAVITTNRDGSVASLNPVAEQLTGWTAAEAVGQPLEQVFRLINEDDRSTVPDPAARALSEGQPVTLATRTLLVRRDGTERAIDDSAAPIRDAHGKVLGAVLIFRDVTEQRRADATRQHLAAVVASSDDAIITKDLNGVITTWNDGARRIFGYEAEEVIGKSIMVLIPPELRGEEDDILRRLRAGQRVLPFETVRVAKGGRRLNISVTSSPIRDTYGRIVGASKIARDITLRRRTERVNQFLSESSTALADLNDYEATLQKVVRLSVPAFADLSAVDILTDSGLVRRLALVQSDPALETVAQEMFRRHAPLATDEHGAMMVLRTGKSVFYKKVPESFLRDVAQDNDHFEALRALGPRSYMCVPIRSRWSAVGALTFSTTTSGREYDETDLRAAEDLAHRAAIAIENASLVATLRESDRKKDEFLAMLAHELRNPLGPIRNAAQIIRIRTPPAAELTWATDMIERQVQQLTRLVDDLLDVSRITSGKITLRQETVNAGDVLRAVLENSRPQIANRGHELRVAIPEAPILVQGDPVRLGQVLFNLVDNAVKYTDPGGVIAVSLSVEDGQAEFSVKDNGVGIASDMLDRIFEMFTQVERSLDRSQGGLGIGLMLVHSLVAMHGGSVQALSDGPETGSEFVVRLPLAP